MNETHRTPEIAQRLEELQQNFNRKYIELDKAKERGDNATMQKLVQECQDLQTEMKLIDPIFSPETREKVLELEAFKENMKLLAPYAGSDRPISAAQYLIDREQIAPDDSEEMKAAADIYTKLHHSKKTGDEAITNSEFAKDLDIDEKDFQIKH